MKTFYALVLCAFIFSNTLLSQELLPTNAPLPITGVLNKTDGLELPEPTNVDNTEGFVLVQAKSLGKVKWLVVSSSKVKYVANDDTNSLIVAVPQTGKVNIFAVALLKDKLTEFVQTTISVNESKVDDSNVNPKPKPTPAYKENLHITFLFDFNDSNTDIASIVNSKSIRDTITSLKSYFKVYDISSNIVKSKKLDSLLKETGNTLFIVQASDGTVLHYSAIPKTENEVLEVIKKITKGE